MIAYETKIPCQGRSALRVAAHLVVAFRTEFDYVGRLTPPSPDLLVSEDVDVA